MKYILIISLILGSEASFAEKQDFVVYDKPIQRSKASDEAQQSAFVGTTEPSAVQKAFLEKTNIKLGEYVLTQSSDINCLEGELKIIDLNDRVTLMLGAKPIAIALGKKKFEEKENEDCKVTFDATYSETEIKETREKICKKEKQSLKTKIKLGDGKLSYRTVITTNGKISNEYSCDLRLDVSADFIDIK